MSTGMPNLDEDSRAVVLRKLDGKTKPRGSLGRLEELAASLAAMQGSDRPVTSPRAIVVMAGDHGVAQQGVSAYPSEVTAQMVANFASGGAAINVLTRQMSAQLVVVDMGVISDANVNGVRKVRIAPGTADFTRGPAMTVGDCERALGAGAAIAEELAAAGTRLVGIGEMGIGNSTAAAALTAAYTGLSAEEVTGRGTGVDDNGLRRKIDAVRAALAANPEASRPSPSPDGAMKGDRSSPLGTLAALGGYEIAGLAGLTIACARRRIPVVVDGFIASAAALAASRIAPGAERFLVPSHKSVEVGHRKILSELKLRPLFDLDLRLGEGTGAALALGFVDAAVRILEEMATFEAAGVTDSGR
jgi:nicotinate-nucleotide--dimethylbenzimidazole phosphoribosyltransferase